MGLFFSFLIYRALDDDAPAARRRVFMILAERTQSLTNK